MMPTLRELREAVGKSRAQVAADLGMSERHLFRLEHGQSTLRTVTRIAFADYYNVRPADIEDET
jgi:transcriptional regulator with XRE-family HTH domain